MTCDERAGPVEAEGGGNARGLAVVEAERDGEERANDERGFKESCGREGEERVQICSVFAFNKAFPLIETSAKCTMASIPVHASMTTMDTGRECMCDTLGKLCENLTQRRGSSNVCKMRDGV